MSSDLASHSLQTWKKQANPLEYQGIMQNTEAVTLKLYGLEHSGG
ncbi:hypothetical protein [Methanomethylovorans sp.]